MTPETATERIYTLCTRMAYGSEMTTQEIAGLLNLSRSGAYALMWRLSRIAPLRLEAGKWKLEEEKSMSGPTEFGVYQTSGHYMLDNIKVELANGVYHRFTAISSGVTRTNAVAKLADTLKQYRAFKKELDQRTELSDAVKSEIGAALRDTAAAHVEMITRQFQRLPTPVPPALIAVKDAAYHAAAARAWERTRAQLNAGVALETIIAHADAVTLEAIREEAPSYFRTEHASSPDLAEKLGKQAEIFIGERELTFLTAEQLEQRAAAERAGREQYAFEFSANMALTEARGGTPASMLVNLDKTPVQLGA